MPSYADQTAARNAKRQEDQLARQQKEFRDGLKNLRDTQSEKAKQTVQKTKYFPESSGEHGKSDSDNTALEEIVMRLQIMEKLVVALDKKMDRIQAGVDAVHVKASADYP